ncbi:MAG: succinylglutamate desuccinylase/aspartoacylase family protein [Clostridia bacterium]
MIRKVLFEIPSIYRDDLRVTGYYFGNPDKKTACVVGSTRGNENQQLYVCSQLIKALDKMQNKGKISQDVGILVVPTLNTYSLNTKKRFWGIDNTDINRMFPGYSQGETTQRIAGAVFENINDYKYGMQFASFYMQGNFMPHVRVMSIDEHSDVKALTLAKDFGLPYIVDHDPRPFDTATLNYNWQVWGTKAFSIYTTDTEKVDKESATKSVQAILNFLAKHEIIDCKIRDFHESKVVTNHELVTIRAKQSGFLDSFVKVGDKVQKGQVLADIIHSFEGYKIGELVSTVDGTIFFAQNESKLYSNTAVYKIDAN